jgi:hypothetical protein
MESAALEKPEWYGSRLLEALLTCNCDFVCSVVDFEDNSAFGEKCSTWNSAQVVTSKDVPRGTLGSVVL